MNRPLLILAAALLCASLGINAQTPVPAPAAGNATRGKDVYLKVGCDQCHGREAQGSPTTGPRLGPGALPIAAFTLFIRKPRVQMPPYSPEILSEADVADIYAYVSGRPPPVAADRIPD